MARPKITLSDVFGGYNIQTSNLGSRRDVLDVIVRTFHYMWHRCGKRLCVCHFTINMPPDSNLTANDIISNMLQSWRRTLLNRNIDAEYIWVREKGDHASSCHPHYHVFTLLPGRAFQFAKAISRRLNDLLSRRLGKPVMLVHVNPPREDSFCWGKKVSARLDNLADAVFWTSYLAKVGTKEAPPCQRSFGFSKGFLNSQPPPFEISPEWEARCDEFESEDFRMSDEDWQTWGYGSMTPAEYLNFDPETGGPYVKRT